MGEQSIKEYKLHLLLLKEWKRKTSPENTAKIVNKVLGSEFISEFHVNEWYKCFENGNLDILFKPLSIRSFNVKNGTSEALYDSLFSISGDENLKGGTFAKNGRFLISRVSDKGSINIHDLFNGTKRSTHVSFKHSKLGFICAGDYLIYLEVPDVGPYKAHLLKINYDTLTGDELDAIDVFYVSRGLYLPIILPDHSNNHRFMIYYDSDSFTIGQIQDDKIVMEDKIYCDSSVWHEERLIGNKVQYFRSYNGMLIRSMTFYELDVNTLEQTHTDVSIKLENSDVELESWHNNGYCWSKDSFYAFYKTTAGHYQLLSFNSNTFKWSDVQISVNVSTNLYIDENDVLTLKVGGYHKEVNAYYRVAIRKPDTLTNLTLMAAVREANLYGNETYINVAREIGI